MREGGNEGRRERRRSGGKEGEREERGKEGGKLPEAQSIDPTCPCVQPMPY